MDSNKRIFHIPCEALRLILTKMLAVIDLYRQLGNEDIAVTYSWKMSV
jgi:hypothetical protein